MNDNVNESKLYRGRGNEYSVTPIYMVLLHIKTMKIHNVLAVWCIRKVTKSRNIIYKYIYTFWIVTFHCHVSFIIALRVEFCVNTSIIVYTCIHCIIVKLLKYFRRKLSGKDIN